MAKFFTISTILQLPVLLACYLFVCLTVISNTRVIAGHLSINPTQALEGSGAKGRKKCLIYTAYARTTNGEILLPPLFGRKAARRALVRL